MDNSTRVTMDLTVELPVDITILVITAQRMVTPMDTLSGSNKVALQEILPSVDEQLLEKEEDHLQPRMDCPLHLLTHLPTLPGQVRHLHLRHPQTVQMVQLLHRLLLL